MLLDHVAAHVAATDANCRRPNCCYFSSSFHAFPFYVGDDDITAYSCRRRCYLLIWRPSPHLTTQKTQQRNSAADDLAPSFCHLHKELLLLLLLLLLFFFILEEEGADDEKSSCCCRCCCFSSSSFWRRRVPTTRAVGALVV
jgi:hypothetical protein